MSRAGLLRRLVRARRKLGEDPDEAVEDLLELAAELPEAVRVLIEAAAEAAGGARMPIFYAALERLADVRPEDPEALLALADYRALHLDEPAARELFLAARDLAPDQATRARALSGLAALAESAARADEAIAHLRNAVRLVDDPQLFARLARLLLPRDRAEAVRMWTRALVLAPDDPELQRELEAARQRPG